MLPLLWLLISTSIYAAPVPNSETATAPKPPFTFYATAQYVYFSRAQLVSEYSGPGITAGLRYGAGYCGELNLRFLKDNFGFTGTSLEVAGVAALCPEIGPWWPQVGLRFSHSSLVTAKEQEGDYTILKNYSPFFVGVGVTPLRFRIGSLVLGALDLTFLVNCSGNLSTRLWSLSLLTLGWRF